MRWEKVVHNHKMDFRTTGKFDTVKAVESRKKGMWVFFDMLVIVLEYGSKKFVLGM